MKRYAFAIALAMSSLAASVFASATTVQKATVEYWNGWEFTEDTTLSVGSTKFVFKGGKFVTSTKTIDDALNDFYSSYTELREMMVSGGMTAAQANYNMAIWSEQMTAEMYKGIADQQAIDAEAIQNANDGTEEAARAVAELTQSTCANIIELKGSLSEQLSQVSGNNASLITSLATTIQQKSQELEQKITELNNSGGASAEAVNAIQDSVNKLSAEIAMSTKAKSELEQSVADMKSNIKTISEKLVTLGTFTNEMKRVSAWLGFEESEEESNPGVFLRPTKPNGDEYAEDSNFMNLLSDYGVVSFSSVSNQQFEIVPLAYNFTESIDGSETNITASFGAPNNWAGDAIFVSNGVFGTVEPVTWVTNITQNFDARAAITNIFNDEYARMAITNIFNDMGARTAVTSVFNNIDARTVFTNLYVTEVYRSTITNLYFTEDHRKFVTNLVFNTYNRTFITNVVTNYNQTLTNFLTIVGVPVGDGSTPMERPANEDPYNPQYEEGENPAVDNLLPVENARNIVAITNEPLSRIESSKLFDEASIWTNSNNVAELRGFEEAGNDSESGGDCYFPLKRVFGEEDIRLEWQEFPFELTNIVVVLTNDIDIVEGLEIIKRYNSNSIIKNNITMTTNLFAVVKPETLLDDLSVWTNGEAKIEIKGFENAPQGSVPVADVDEETGESVLEWRPHVIPDGRDEPFEVFYSSIDWQRTSNGDTFKTGVIEVAGFMMAEEGTVPVKVEKLENPRGEAEYTFEWKPYNALALRFQGSNDTGEQGVVVGSGTKTNNVKFVMGTNTGGSVTCESDENGGVKITLDVEWK